MKIASTQFTLATESFEIYLSGCRGNCKGCSNPEIKNFNVGEVLNQEKINSILDKIYQFPNIIKHVWILGGEPLDNDRAVLKNLLKILRTTNKKIWLWTRYEIEEIPEDILELCEYVKCGAYREELSCEDNIQEGIKLATSNQKIYKIEKPKSPISLTINNKKVRLHNYLFSNFNDEFIIDHKDGDKLNNKYDNLQKCTQQFNTLKKSKQKNNTSNIIGVSKNHNNWQAKLKNKDIIFNKTFKTKEEAIIQRLIWELECLKDNSPQIDLINKEYTFLLNILKVDNMKFNSDITKVIEIGKALKQSPYCPCMLTQNDNTICPCLPCRTKQYCCCGLFVKIEKGE